MNNVVAYIKYLAKWISDYANKYNIKNVIVGISGGVDSAVTAAIIKKHTQLNLTCVYMDINNSLLDTKCVKLMEQYLQIKIKSVKLDKQCKEIYKLAGAKKSITLANIKPRIRMVMIYALASELNALVIGTSNRDELYLGYFTKYGDSGCDLMPLSNLNKSEIYLLAKELKIPKEIINRAPSAGLYKNQTDEKEMGVSYRDIDAYLNKKKIGSKAKLIIDHHHKNNLHKLEMPPKPTKYLKKY